jgi:hypothetical protein
VGGDEIWEDGFLILTCSYGWRAEGSLVAVGSAVRILMAKSDLTVKHQTVFGDWAITRPR